MSFVIVWVVWYGRFEDADVDSIFTKREDAEAYVRAHPGMYIRDEGGDELWDQVPPVE